MPSPGNIVGLRAPGGPWVRDDSGVYAGCTVPRFYDTLIAKLIVWGPDRDAAIARMARALGEYTVAGVQTTIPILQRIIAHAGFRGRAASPPASWSACWRPTSRRRRAGTARSR